MFNNLESLFQNIRSVSGNLKDFVTFATILGALGILFYSTKLLFALVRGFRLYVLSQFFCNKNNTRRYGHWAVVTGAANGIGRAMARELARRGHSIVALDIDAQHLIETKTILEREPNVGQVVALTVDLSDSSLENYGRLEKQLDLDNREIGVLINCAGVLSDKVQRFANHDLKTFHDMIKVNVMATVSLTRLILPKMIERQKGLVVNVSSVAGATTAPYLALYGVTKTFINQFSKTLRIEYPMIDFITLEPGAVHTNMLVKSAKLSEPTVFSPTPEEFAETAMNAISTRISSINGTWALALCGVAVEFLDKLGLGPYLVRMSAQTMSKNYSVSPVPKRKKLVCGRPETDSV